MSDMAGGERRTIIMLLAEIIFIFIMLTWIFCGACIFGHAVITSLREEVEEPALREPGKGRKS